MWSSDKKYNHTQSNASNVKKRNTHNGVNNSIQQNMIYATKEHAPATETEYARVNDHPFASPTLLCPIFRSLLTPQTRTARVARRGG